MNHWKTLQRGAVLFVLAGAMVSCVSKATSEARVQAAYLAGRQSALMEQQQQGNSPGVTLRGAVQHSFVPWRPGLTLGQAIVSAVYEAEADPSIIIIHRNGEAISIDPKQLLAGTEIPLERGDVIELQQ
jgi:hypothetical protein